MTSTARGAPELCLALLLAMAAAVESTPAARHAIAAIDAQDLIAMVNQLGAAMAEGMPMANPAD